MCGLRLDVQLHCQVVPTDRRGQQKPADRPDRPREPVLGGRPALPLKPFRVACLAERQMQARGLGYLNPAAARHELILAGWLLYRTWMPRQLKTMEGERQFSVVLAEAGGERRRRIRVVQNDLDPRGACKSRVWHRNRQNRLIHNHRMTEVGAIRRYDNELARHFRRGERFDMNFEQQFTFSRRDRQKQRAVCADRPGKVRLRQRPAGPAKRRGIAALAKRKQQRHSTDDAAIRRKSSNKLSPATDSDQDTWKSVFSQLTWTPFQNATRPAICLAASFGAG